MPRYTTHKKKFKKIDIGSMNCRIKVLTRAIRPPIGTNVNYNLNFSDFVPVANVWADMESTDGITMFDDTNTERVITDIFYTRYIPGITFTKWIEYRGNYYRIYKVENLQNENKFYMIYTGITGDKIRPVDWA